MAARKTENRKNEKRRETRVPYPNLLKSFNILQAGAPSEKHSFEGNIVDLSESGIGLSIAGGNEGENPGNLLLLLEEGTLVRLRVPITESLVTMPVLGQIIWRRNSKQKKELRTGIRFVI